MTRVLARSEQQEQELVCEWFHHQFPALRGLLFASANGLHIAGSERDRAIKWLKFRRAGGRNGVADLFLAVPAGAYHGMFVEMKAKGGRLSPEQQTFLADMQAQGYHTAVCRGMDEGVAALRAYLQEHDSSRARAFGGGDAQG